MLSRLISLNIIIMKAKVLSIKVLFEKELIKMKKMLLILTSVLVIAMGSAFSAPSTTSTSIKSPVFVRTTVQNNIEIKKLKFNVDGESILGTLTIPKGGENYPIVIIDTQKGEEKDGMDSTFSLLSTKLAKEGIASFRFDYPTNDIDLSSAIKIVTDYLASLDEIDQGRIGLFGWAQGTEDIKSVILDGTDTYSSILTWSKNADKDIDVPRVPPVSERFRRHFRRRFPFGPRHLAVRLADGRLIYLDTALRGPRVQYYDIDLPNENTNYFGTEVSISTESPSVYKIYTSDLSQVKDYIDDTVDWYIQTL